jgi:hypothetical protein
MYLQVYDKAEFPRRGGVDRRREQRAGAVAEEKQSRRLFDSLQAKVFASSPMARTQATAPLLTVTAGQQRQRLRRCVD